MEKLVAEVGVTLLRGKYLVPCMACACVYLYLVYQEGCMI